METQSFERPLMHVNVVLGNRVRVFAVSPEGRISPFHLEEGDLGLSGP